MGKTNLLIHTKRSLENEYQLFIYVDLSTKLPTSRECFRNLIDTLLASGGRSVLLNPTELAAIRENNFAPNKEFEASLLAILRVYTGKLVFILDEIDALIDTDYSDEVFAQIRSVYFTRVTHRAFERLTFLLSGVSEPSTIIKDRTKSPFNIGEKIYLDDFSFVEFEELLTLAELPFSTQVKQCIFEWAHGHPRMTWEICSVLEDSFLSSVTVTPAHIEKVTNSLYLERFDTAPVDHIRDLVRSDKSILRAVKQINIDPSLPIADLTRKKLYLT